MVNNLSSRYITEIYDGSGNLIADLSGKVRGLTFSVTRNRAENISLTLDMNQMMELARGLKQNVSELFAVDINEVRILREDSDGINNIVAGQIDLVVASLDGNDKTLVVQARGWLDLFSKRYTAASVTHTATDASTIAWNSINTSQGLSNGNFGITQGALTTSKTRTRTYEYKDIKELIIQLSEVIDGFDFEFTWDKIFNTFYPRQGADNADAITLEYPRNIKTINLPIDGTAIVNKVIARGQGFGDEQLVEERTDATSQLVYKLRERVADFNDVKESTTLQEHGDEILRVDTSPFAIPQITLRENSSPVIKKEIWVDDPVKVNVLEDDFFDAIKGIIYRIESINVGVDENGIETVGFNVSQA